MSTGNKKEFGDYQTPPAFCEKVLDYLINESMYEVEAVVEPTCGIGNFLVAASKRFNKPMYGVEINREYADEAKRVLPSAIIESKNIFDVKIREICTANNVLVIGNPPWATNAELSFNLPKKENFKGLKGLDALTGSANFDICEYIILQMLNAYMNTNSTICMLCKSSVARNVILEIDRNHIAYDKIEMLNFNSNKVFGISAAACVLIIKLSANQAHDKVFCTVKNFESNETVDELVANDGILKTTKNVIDLEGSCQLTWRQGVKHDCGKVMELEKKGDTYVNKYKESFALEDDIVFPLVKSSHFKTPIITDFKKYVIVTQKKAKEDTSYISSLPLTWAYLNRHIDDFNNRKSVIYKKSAPFAMFGVGDYSYKRYKVGLSGFYKKPLFCLLYSDDGKPVMTDDTAYFLAFDSYEIAYGFMLLLNSPKIQDFLLSIAFLDNKRPYTVKLLSRLDLRKCIENVSFSELKNTEDELKLDDSFSEELYAELKEYIESL